MDAAEHFFGEIQSPDIAGDQDRLHSLRRAGTGMAPSFRSLRHTVNVTDDGINSTVESAELAGYSHSDIADNPPPLAVAQSSQNGGVPFMWFVVIVTLTALFFFACIVGLVKRRLLMRRNSGDDGADATREGMVFDLTARQRRAVLEAIFSDNSKNVEPNEFKKKKQKKRRKKDSKKDEEKPSIPTEVSVLADAAATEASSSDHMDNEEDNLSALDEEAGLAQVTTDWTRELDRSGLSFQAPDTPATHYSAGGDSESSVGDSSSIEGGIPLAVPDLRVPRDSPCASSLPCRSMSRIGPRSSGSAIPPFSSAGDSGSERGAAAQKASPPPVTTLGPFSRKEGEAAEEEKREEEEIGSQKLLLESREAVPAGTMATLAMAVAGGDRTCVNSVSDEEYTINTGTEYTDGGESVPVCAICICAYEEGEQIIRSNHCPHLFHKQCILEWLDKHDDCPVCRAGMVTPVEMRRAASSIVGEVRMVRAVETMDRRQRIHASLAPISFAYSPSMAVINP